MLLRKIVLASAIAGLSLGATDSFAANATSLSEVQQELDAAVSSADIAALAVENPVIAQAIITAALQTGAFAVEDIVIAAIELDPDNAALIVRAAAGAEPELAGSIVFSAASALGLTPGGAQDDRDLPATNALAEAAVRGVESSLGPTSPETAAQVTAIAAELLPFLGPDAQQSFANNLAETTVLATDSGASIIEDVELAALGDGVFDSSTLLTDLDLELEQSSED